MTAHPLRLLSIYRGKLDENRGTPIRARSLTERLARTPGFSVTVASWDPEAVIAGARHVTLSNRKIDDLKTLLKIVRKEQVDIVLGNTMATWYYLLALKLLTRAKIALEMHGFIEIEARFYGSISLLRFWAERVTYGLFYPLCDLITTCSDNAAEILSHFNRNVVPLYGGVDADLFSPDARPLDSVRKEPGETLICYAGNLRKWQGVPFLLAAFRRLHAEDPSFRLAILSSEAKELPPESGIDIYGHVPHDEVPAFLAACDVLVIPREDDEVSRISFPSKLPEYLAMGKPVVASRTSDAHRVIEDGTDGLLFPPGDTDAFLAALRRLKDPVLRSRIGDEARRTVMARFRWDTQAAILATRLQALLTQHVQSRLEEK